MLFALCLAASLAPAADPAPLPDRWLLKLVPENLPPTPDRLHAVTWYDSYDARNIDSAWELWVEFHKADRERPAEAILTLTGGTPTNPPTGRRIGLWQDRPLSTPGRRAVPLAVHGPLVEFDRRLYTATTGVWKFGRKDIRDRELLHLGSAVELKDRVWYQAGTRVGDDGKTVSVEEWRLEFKDDPRMAAEGVVTVRGHWRVLTEPEGESFAAELRFKAEPPNERTLVRIVTFDPPAGKKLAHKLPYLSLGNEKGLGGVIWVDGQDRLSLYPARAKPPKPLVPEPSGLVQPPARKPGK